MSLKDKQLFIFDLDGTLYLDGVLFKGTNQLIKRLEDQGKHVVFLTNNSSRSTQMYVSKLNSIGLKTTSDHVVTSTQSAVAHIKRYHQDKCFYVMATNAVKDEIKAAGIRVEDDLKKNVHGVLLTYDTNLTYQKIEDVTKLLKRDVIYLATHPDMVCPTSFGSLPDIGTFIAMFYEATAKLPKVLGKPDPEILRVACDRFKVSSDETVMVGDRLYTDIQVGINAGIDTVLMLSGETTAAMLHASTIKPTHVFNTVLELLEELT